MDLRVTLASALTACLAFVLLGVYPNTLVTSAWNLPHHLGKWTVDQAIIDHGQPDLSPAKPFDVLYHLGGNGPWIPKVRNVTGDSIEPPEGCRVDQVHMMSRHAERYPTVAVGMRMLELFERIQQANVTLRGDLAFANDWEFFSDVPVEQFENLVSTGPYAGTLEAFASGVKLRTRYKHLLDEAIGAGTVSFWSSDSKRVMDTARYFGVGFFGIRWEDQATLHIIPESPDQGADTLTPGRTCSNYRNDVDRYGHQYGYRMMDMIRSTYEPAIVRRLAKQNPDLEFAEGEIFIMQCLCGFETIVKGSSHWCKVFTEEEWESFEYARDVIHFYRAGPGNPYSASMGWLWLNATANLLKEGDSAGPLFFSFVHDGDIIPLLSALNLLPQEPNLPITHVLHNRTWRTSDVVPMGGRIIFERLACAAPQECWTNAPFYPNHVYCEPPSEDIYVRINVNDGIVAIPGCEGGPGRSCPLEEFLERVSKRGKELEEFRKICGLEDDSPERIRFLHQ